MLGGSVEGIRDDLFITVTPTLPNTIKMTY